MQHDPKEMPESMMIDASAQPAPDVLAVVCVPTFRRPAMLRDTLASLAAQRTAISFRVLVIDNDADGRDGLAVAEATFAEGPLRGAALLEPQQGNCHAINAALRQAGQLFPDARYLLMIDDDEIASPEWLDRMVATAEAEKADIVGGPVFSTFSTQPHPGLAAHPVFWPAYDRSGSVPMIYGSGNFLVRQAARLRLANPEFDVAFNFLGGGDTDFFTRCKRAGFRFYWNQEARIDETVPPTRANARWVLQRSMRIGAINYRLDQSADARGPIRAIGKNVLLVPLSLYRGAKRLIASGSLLQASHPPAIALGRILASLGVEGKQYRAKTTAEAKAKAGTLS
ncbi:glycosyltransferase family 2 protein [Lichenihabitans psoromatis]|uniref:glycosyltransferase family 2 protein n=2 Tax=Lichenihabitans psoromatis TaxID=2528642 RepID=UPI001FDFE3B2|nr:glycosyltransferase family 2 protein [Lichenihabitans psoromatis]